MKFLIWLPYPLNKKNEFDEILKWLCHPVHETPTQRLHKYFKAFSRMEAQIQSY